MERVPEFKPDTRPDAKPNPSPAAEAYYFDAATWSADVHGALRASRRRAWWVAGVAAAIALVQAIALALLLPLKTVVPYTITVDRQTGAAQPARSVALGALAGNEALIQSTLAQYVIARETLDATDLAANYRKVGLWSAGTARSDYLRSMDRSNPASVLIGADSATRITTTIKSVSLTSPGTALVRFATDRRDGDGPIARRDWAAVIGFAFSDGPLDVEDRLINPLGFQVTRYRRDPETLAPQIILPAALPRAAQPETSR
ncbi:hypothetical protein IP88_11995 [alpha proteobacterium AAP81b]|nr:hypothetical protein IP88_11995 [alpha proteobacterium AAP81b]